MWVRALTLLSLAAAAHGLLFDVDVGRSRCIGDILGRHDVVRGTWKVEGLPEGTRSGFDVKITGPANEIEYSQSDAAGGKFAFTATDAGYHRACFTNGGNQVRRISFEMLAGIAAKDYSDIVKKEHLEPLELELRMVEDRIDAVQREMVYQREREETHRNTNESTNSRVVWYSLASIFVLVSVSVTQVAYLFRYLKQKRIIQK